MLLTLLFLLFLKALGDLSVQNISSGSLVLDPHTLFWEGSGFVLSSQRQGSIFTIIDDQATLLAKINGTPTAVVSSQNLFYVCSGNNVTAFNRLDWTQLWSVPLTSEGPPCEEIVVDISGDLLVAQPSLGIIKISSKGETVWKQPPTRGTGLCFWTPQVLVSAHSEGLFACQLNPNGTLGDPDLILFEGTNIVNPLKVRALENQNLVVINHSHVFVCAFDGREASILQYASSNSTSFQNIALRPGRTTYTIYGRQYHHLVLLGSVPNQTWFTIWHYAVAEVYVAYPFSWIVSISVVSIVLALVIVVTLLVLVWRRLQRQPQRYD